MEDDRSSEWVVFAQTCVAPTVEANMGCIPGHLAGALTDPTSFIKNVFHNDDLRVISSQSLESTGLPAESQIYLAQVGLPRREETLESRFTLTFAVLDEGLPQLSELADREQFHLSNGSSQYLCIDIHLRHKRALCLDPMRAGLVLDVDLEGEQHETFVNSRVEKLGIFLATFIAHCRETANWPLDRIQDADKQLHGCMREIDLDALIDPDTWWARVMEEILGGLL